MNNLGVTSHHPGLADGPIYLDYNTTTPVDPRAAETTQPIPDHAFWNPPSGHAYASSPTTRWPRPANNGLNRPGFVGGCVVYAASRLGVSVLACR
jgi:cysteine desulfurase